MSIPALWVAFTSYDVNIIAIDSEKQKKRLFTALPFTIEQQADVDKMVFLKIVLISMYVN